ncbi:MULTISPECIES: YciI family protein [unclassified Rhizobium]|uniref:YciI family protein n=1 Tax=unclassified Rhizobium TaxID=2613769 RepID=UPI001610610D|nr:MULTISPECIES: YciI family protein [unclassified Rhizobium]MBB3544471.1 hypothetical protein [Rhizobium sp. BK399]MCS3742546.1 hypothetical protein [Rhizobium sp. BK661]MCS4094511.1 hypothetical protein [Rhizobium sp. BK176]
MLYVVHCLDHENAQAKRLANYDDHKAYLSTGAMKTVVSGPVLADDHETMIGSLFIFDATTKQEVVDFNEDDPFKRAGVWRSVSIYPFNKRVDNR